MKKHKSRFKHTFAGQAEGEPLVNWLNSADAGQPRADIAEAISLFREAQDAMRRTGKAGLDALTADPGIQVKTQHVQWLLSKYPFRPALMPGAVSFRWFPAWEDDPSRFLMALRFGKYGPENAILGVMRLTEKGLLDRVKQCLCGKWIFAKFPQEQHCCAAHRLQAHRAKPTWKEDRREWRQGNREVHERIDKNEGTMKRRVQ